MIEKTLLLAIIGIIVSATTIYTNPLFQKITNEDILLTLKIVRAFFVALVLTIVALVVYL